MTWAEETMQIINRLTEDIKGKAFDPDWFLLRQRLEDFESKSSKEPNFKHALAEKEERNGWHYRVCVCGMSIGPFHNPEYADDALDYHIYKGRGPQMKTHDEIVETMLVKFNDSGSEERGSPLPTMRQRMSAALLAAGLELLSDVTEAEWKNANRSHWGTYEINGMMAARYRSLRPLIIHTCQQLEPNAMVPYSDGPCEACAKEKAESLRRNQRRGLDDGPPNSIIK